MADGYPVSAKFSSSTDVPRGDGSAGLRDRFRSRRLSCGTDEKDANRQDSSWRSSYFSEYSLKEARNVFKSSTENLLLPMPETLLREPGRVSSPWHSIPLAFALFPAVAGVLFTNGSNIAADIMLIGLASIFLNWSIRLPWDWYHAAQSIKKFDRQNICQDIRQEKDDESTTPNERLQEQPKEGLRPEFTENLSQEAAANELCRYELLALFSCFVLPLIGAYLLHALRSQLHGPSEGLVSNYNLTIFLLASELKPLAHVAKLIQARTMHLQRIVAFNPYEKDIATVTSKDISQRLDNLEARCVLYEKASSKSRVGEKQINHIISEMRKTLQPDLDALNRSVRRYEKRAMVQTFHTDAKLQELEKRLNDAVSLAAAAVSNKNQRHASTETVFEWTFALIILPFRIMNILISFPLRLKGTYQIGKSIISRKHILVERAHRPVNDKLYKNRPENWSLAREAKKF